jgi:hypothetical protein
MVDVPSKGYQPIENYGIIGDLYTVALVGMDGSIDFMAFPHFCNRFDVIKQTSGCTERPPAKSWRVQKLSADLTAD